MCCACQRHAKSAGSFDIDRSAGTLVMVDEERSTLAWIGQHPSTHCNIERLELVDYVECYCDRVYIY